MATQTLSLPDTTIGKKVMMAVSGVVLFGFLIGHMAGNLQVFLGHKPYNEYAKFLHDNAALIWGARTVLLMSVAVHIVAAVQLIKANREARPVRYKMKKSIASTYASKTMKLSGPLILAYIIYHLAHFTFGVTAGLGYEHLPRDAEGLPDVYYNVVQSFQIPWLVALYAIAQVLLGLHLYHGAWSVLQSLGINHRRYNLQMRGAASAIALAIVAGFLAVPFGVLFGLVDPAG
ncbi:MAG: succinate dehydrogenase cytochrome b subunit [Myxococcota bacterium]